MTTPTQTSLSESLAAAGAAHHDFEQVDPGGNRDELRAGFYAAYVLGRLGDFAPAGTLSRWLEEVPNEPGWAELAARQVLDRLGARD